MAEPSEGLLDTEEVAGYLGVGQVTIYRWCREGGLPCVKIVKIRRRWRVGREALEEFVSGRERSGMLAGRSWAFRAPTRGTPQAASTSMP